MGQYTHRYNLQICAHLNVCIQFTKKGNLLAQHYFHNRLFKMKQTGRGADVYLCKLNQISASKADTRRTWQEYTTFQSMAQHFQIWRNDPGYTSFNNFARNFNSCETTPIKPFSFLALVVPAEITVIQTEKYWAQWENTSYSAPSQKRVCFAIQCNSGCSATSSDFSLPFSL